MLIVAEIQTTNIRSKRRNEKITCHFLHVTYHMSHVPCHQQPQTIPLLNPPTLSVTFYVSFWSHFWMSLLDIPLKHHFWMSLFDIPLQHHFGHHFWTLLSEVTFGKIVFMLKPLEALFLGESDGTADRQTHRLSNLWTELTYGRIRENLYVSAITPLLEITRHEPEQSYTKSIRLWQECRLS